MERYKKLRQLGSGAFGVTYEVDDRISRDIRVIKILKILIPEKKVSAFQRDLYLLLKLNHMNIAKIFDARVLTTPNNAMINVMRVPTAAIVMKRVDDNLRDKVNQRTVIDDSWNKKLFQQLQCGIEYLHSKSITHGNVKPENLLLKWDILKISDIGLTKGGIFDSNNVVCDSSVYTAPEIQTTERYDRSIDIYSMGIILIELYTPVINFKNWIGTLNFSEYTTSMPEKNQLSITMKYLVSQMIKNPIMRPQITKLLEHF